MQLALFVAVNGVSPTAVANDCAAAGFDLVDRIGVRGRPYPITDEMSGDCSVGLQEGAGLDGGMRRGS
jgi:hypothetical protein